MTKQEVKEEYKQQEGDPQIKGRIRQRMREASQRRMMQNLPQADVVITNPTHYAVAIKYDPEVADAPIVIAKGEDYLAAKIKEIARDHQIEIVENKPLARMLYANVDVGQAVPPELYQAVAEFRSNDGDTEKEPGGEKRAHAGIADGVQSTGKGRCHRQGRGVSGDYDHYRGFLHAGEKYLPVL